MLRKSILLALCATLAGGAAVAAQMPGPPGPEGPMRMDPAAMLLAGTGELQLSDAQVVKLAAIARRAADRRRALRASFDSLRPPAARPDSAGRAALRARGEAMRTRMTQLRDAQHTDLRDAIAVLTTDQQARAWELMARRHMAGRAGERMAPGAMPRMRRDDGADAPRRRMGPGGAPGGARPDGDGAPVRTPPAR